MIFYKNKLINKGCHFHQGMTTFFIYFISDKVGIILHNMIIRFKLTMLGNNKLSNEVL